MTRSITRADLLAAGLGVAESDAVPAERGAFCFPGDRLVLVRPGLTPTDEAAALADVLRQYAGAGR